MNFNCVFSSCLYKGNGIEEKEFLNHLKKEHHAEMLEISQKEDIPISMVEMMTISNSKVFVNS